MRSTKDASSACFTGSLSLLGTRADGSGTLGRASVSRWGTAISAGFGTVYAANPGKPRGKTVIGAGGPPEGTRRVRLGRAGRAADEEVLRKGEELVDRRVGALER